MTSRNEGFDRLEQHLLTMAIGEELWSTEAARLSGLDEDTCRAMLQGLARAGLMTHDGDNRFVRRTPDDDPARSG